MSARGMNFRSMLVELLLFFGVDLFVFIASKARSANHDANVGRRAV
jgi:hypothetical protein